MQKRPLWLIAFTCLMMLYQIAWMLNVLQLPDDLKAQISLSVPLEVIVSLVIVILFTFGLYALVAKREWAIRYTIGVFGLQIGYTLLRLILFADADYDRQRLPFLLILFSIVCGVFLLSKKLRAMHNSTN